MIIGFTGHRRELSGPQSRMLTGLVISIGLDTIISSVHHGDCVGADAAFDALCEGLGIKREAHPGPDGPDRAYCDADVIHEQRPYLQRNHDIVDVCDLLIACPRGAEIQRSGTWSTIRYARRLPRRIVIVWPDGSTEPARFVA